MHIYINEVTLWLLVIIALSVTLVWTVIYRLHKWFSRRCTAEVNQGEYCRSLRVERLYEIIFLEAPTGYWWNHYWVLVKTSTLTKCRKCGTKDVEKTYLARLSRLHILCVRIFDPNQLQSKIEYHEEKRRRLLKNLLAQQRSHPRCILGERIPERSTSRLRLRRSDDFSPHDLTLY